MNKKFLGIKISTIMTLLVCFLCAVLLWVYVAFLEDEALEFWGLEAGPAFTDQPSLGHGHDEVSILMCLSEGYRSCKGTV